MEKHKIILDVDTGNGMPVRDIDDGLAIAMALAKRTFELAWEKIRTMKLAT